MNEHITQVTEYFQIQIKVGRYWTPLYLSDEKANHSTFELAENYLNPDNMVILTDDEFRIVKINETITETELKTFKF